MWAWPDAEHLYAVGYRGQTVGKIWFAIDRCSEARPWERHLCLPMTLPDDTLGSARSKDEALQMLANSLHTLLLQVPSDRIERALQLSAATGFGCTSGEKVELLVEEIVRPVALTPEQAEAAQALPLRPLQCRSRQPHRHRLLRRHPKSFGGMRTSSGSGCRSC